MSDLKIDITRTDKGKVLSIDVQSENQSIRLLGYCRYWIKNDTIGLFNCEKHLEFGKPISYTWDGERFIRENKKAPKDVKIEHGGWLPDVEWRKLNE